MEALNSLTHHLVNIAAAGNRTADDYSGQFDKYLRDFLGLKDGRTTLLEFRGRRLIPELWLADGGQREDDGSPFSPAARFYRHFHNPLFEWGDAGLLSRYPFHLFPHQYTSSVRWMQADPQSQDDGGAAGGEWAWQNARRLQYLALTTANPREREEAAASLFRALGQIMHLVVDVSVPEHVRNDPHPFGAVSREALGGRTAGNYEYWVSDQQARLGDTAFSARYLSAPIGPHPGVYGLAPAPDEPVARVPVARLVDTDTYRPDAPDPNVTVSGPIGIAEFANANFFSEDTLLGVDPQDRRLPFPRREGLVRRSDVAPVSSRVRAYLQKPAGQGVVTRFALAECRFEGRAAALPPYPCMDEAVWDETAAHMLPRAVGHARAVLDYFFRGSLRVRGVTGVWIDIENTSAEPMEGTFEVYARLGKATAQEHRLQVATVNSGTAVSLEPGAVRRLPISLLPGSPTAYQILVFRGRMGLEADAVAGQVFTVPHVHAAQRSYEADISKTCQTYQFFAELRLETEELVCFWKLLNHRVDGTLTTNFGDRDVHDSRAPAIERIRAFWTGDASGPATLVVHGVEHVDGTWRRHEDEPDPTTFTILDSAARGRSPLWLGVSVRGHIGEFTVPLATFGDQLSEASKKLIVTEPRIIVYSQRTFRLRLHGNSSSYSVVSIGGYPVPTSIMRDQLLVTPNIWREAIQVAGATGTHGVREIEEIPWGPGASAVAHARLNAIMLESPFPRPPDLHWEAELAPKPLDTPTRDFWRTFVASEDPPADRIVLRGYETR